jgi:hypothetical protein
MGRAIDRPGLGAARIGVFALLLAATSPDLAMAAEIESETLGNGVELITVVGDIKVGDEEKFRELSLKFPRAFIALHSNGGAIRPAMEIGRMVRLRGYRTLVLGNSVCASACALIWMAGLPRYLEPGGRLGFHAAYREVDGRLIESGRANAVVGHYLSQLNLSQQAVEFATAASPSEITWLTEANRLDSGIDFETFVASRKRPETETIVAPAPAPAIIPALTPVRIVIKAHLGSKISKSGETFALELADPIVADGKVLIPAGTTGMGEVVHAKSSGGSGASGELVLAARYLDFGGRRLRLRSLNFAVAGKDATGTVNSIAIASAATMPALSLIGFFIKGKGIDIPEGMAAMAKTAEPFVLDPPAVPASEPAPVSPPSEQGTTP